MGDTHKKKIENIVRKPQVDDKEVSESTAACMYCDFNMVESQLDCPNCKNISPFCIITGKRMLRQDWSYCPSCKFPARRPMLLKAAQDGDACPLCDAKITPADVPCVEDPTEHIAEYKALFQSSDKN